MNNQIMMGNLFTANRSKKGFSFLLNFSFIIFACLLSASNGALAMDLMAFQDKYGQIKGFIRYNTAQATNALNRVGIDSGTYIFKPTMDAKTKLFMPVIVYKGGAEPIKLDLALTREQVENEILKLKSTKTLTHPLTITITTQDNQAFQVEEPLIKLSKTIKNLIKDAGEDVRNNPIPLPNVTAKIWGILEKQLERLYDIVHKIPKDDKSEKAAASAETSILGELKLLDGQNLIELIKAANYLDMPILLDLAMEVAKRDIKKITPEQIAQLPREIRNPIISAQMHNILGQFTGELLKIEKGRSIRFSQACVTPDNRKIVAGYGAHDESGIFVWDIKDGKQLLEIKVPQYQVGAVCVTPDGSKIVAGINDGTIRVFDINDGKKLLEIKAGITVGSVAVTPDGTKIVAGFLESRGDMYQDGFATLYRDEHYVIRVWDMQGKQLAQCNGHTGNIWSVCVTPDGTKIVSGSTDKTIRVWDINTGTQLGELRGDTGAVLSVCVTPDGKKIVSGSESTTIRVWDINNGKQLREIKVGYTDSRVCVTPDGTKIVAGFHQAKVLVLDINNGEQLRNFILGISAVLSVCATPDGSKVVAVDLDTIYALDISLFDHLSKITQEQALKIWQYLQGDHKAGWAGISDILK